MERRLQVLNNIAFFVLCLIGIAVGAQRLLGDRNPPVDPRQPTPRISRPAPPVVYKPGEQIAVTGVNFAAANQTLLLVTRQGCKFCDESMPFYRSLGVDAALAKGTRIVLAAPDGAESSRALLARHRVRVDAIVQVPLTRLRVQGTPTAIVVDRAGVVQHVMTGLLDSTGQEELLAALRIGAAPAKEAR